MCMPFMVCVFDITCPEATTLSLFISLAAEIQLVGLSSNKHRAKLSFHIWMGTRLSTPWHHEFAMWEEGEAARRPSQ